MSPFLDYVKAFIIGGAICTVGQVLISKTTLTPARILVAFVTLGVILGAVGVYPPLVEFAGAGATIPLTGFGNTLAQGAIDGALEDGLLGAFTGGIKAAAGGIAAAIFFAYINAVIFKPKTKK
jgi:stage V sporulation protein AE